MQKKPGEGMLILLPHQLFDIQHLPASEKKATLIEESLFFNQFRFHKQKLAFHRASMKYYEAYLKKNGIIVEYVDSSSLKSDIRNYFKLSTFDKFESVHYFDPVDDWLNKRIFKSAEKLQMNFIRHESPMFLNTNREIDQYFGNKNRYFQTDFYITQRKKYKILVDENLHPIGDKWSYDADNRKKYPKNNRPPALDLSNQTKYHKEARIWVENNFSSNYGSVNSDVNYPVTHSDALEWLNKFLIDRFRDFGQYEDAIVANEIFLNHSVLTPMLNVGLLTPDDIISATLKFIETNDTPINSVEGFIRQIIGWREFLRGVYVKKGHIQRTTNYWGFKRKIPKTFWDGTTGIAPVDDTIHKVIKTGYCHHIERLMILGNFMLLCEFDPDEVYKWFMEMFIDSYDWVMVPNVYGMSQFADGGVLSTKPYISGSNYIRKMSDYSSGEWEEIWDALFWRFMDVHRNYFRKNPRLNMLLSSFDKRDDESKRETHFIAQTFLSSLD
jgi:deoxyribodipyrimidine photolyase-related protein